jgi:hypothetical protein
MLSTMLAVVATASSASGQLGVNHHHRPFAGPVIQTPVWSRAPSFADVAAAYPAGAGGVDGSATLFCRFGSAGVLEGCEVTSEAPGGRGFGAAALSLAAKFTVSVDPAWSMGRDRFAVEIPIALPNPAGAVIRDRLITNPVWLTKFSPVAAAAYFPTAAADQGLSTGRGVAECKVEADGALRDCRGVSAQPEGAGFAEAAVKAAASLRMSVWTKDGGPVDGATVRVPIRLTVGDTPADVAGDRVVWLQTPSGTDVLRVFPRPALMRNVGGQVEMRCRVLPDGGVGHCDVVQESPAGWGFGSAAQQLASKYRVSMRGRDHPEPGSWVTVSVPMETASH